LTAISGHPGRAQATDGLGFEGVPQGQELVDLLVPACPAQGVALLCCGLGVGVVPGQGFLEGYPVGGMGVRGRHGDLLDTKRPPVSGQA
jgi:hypothetical protein